MDLKKGNAYHNDMVSCVGKRIDFIGKKNTIQLIYLEFSEAFDSVSQGQLLLQLESYSNIVGWIKD